jgi:transposase InsO family protein
MPWYRKDVKSEKNDFIDDWLKHEFNHADLCKRYDISRPTGYELISRFQEEGRLAVEERSHARHTTPNQTAPAIEAKLITLKHRYPTWGPATIKAYLEAEKIPGAWPAVSTIGEILKRHGLVKPRYKRKQAPAHSEPLRHCIESNGVWSADFKGHFRLSNGKYCYPLTITDNYSRYLFLCQGMDSPSCSKSMKFFEKIFRKYGLPEAIRTDNGQPFAGVGIGGLTRLSIWLLKLGIMPERIERGCPEQNGRHERMHRTLKAATIKPYAKNLIEQQTSFDKFIKEFNHKRPHQALGGKRPAEVYQKSLREMPRKLRAVEYPDSHEVRKVRSSGEIQFAGKKYYVSELLHKERVGLEMIDEGRAIIYYSKLKMGIIDARLDKIRRP